MFCFHWEGHWVVSPFILTALGNVVVVPLCEFYSRFCPQGHVAGGQQVGKGLQASKPLGCLPSGGEVGALFTLELGCLGSNLGVTTW